jgi:hypothetical protein
MLSIGDELCRVLVAGPGFRRKLRRRLAIGTLISPKGRNSLSPVFTSRVAAEVYEADFRHRGKSHIRLSLSALSALSAPFGPLGGRRISRRGQSCVSLVFATLFAAGSYRARFSNVRMRRFCLSRSTPARPARPLDQRTVSSVPLSCPAFFFIYQRATSRPT